MVIPPPLPDAEPEPDIRSHHDGNSFQPLQQQPPQAPATKRDHDVNPTVVADDQHQQAHTTAAAAPSGSSTPTSIRHPRPSFVTTIDEHPANHDAPDEVERHEVHFTLWQNCRNMIRSVPILVAIPVLCPIAWALHFSHQNAVATFVVSLVAIVPLAGGICFATEELAIRIGDTWGGLLNASFGNAVELLVAILALVKGDLDIVQASMAGSILSNVLLVLGASYFAGGLRFHEQVYGIVGAQTHISLLGISIAAILLPEAYHLAFPDTNTAAHSTNRASDAQLSPEELKLMLSMSRGLSFILLIVYGVYLSFQLWTHAYLFKTVREESVLDLPAPHHHRVFPKPQWVPSLRTVRSRDTSTGRGTPSPKPQTNVVVTSVPTSNSAVSVATSVSSHSHLDVQAAVRSPTRVHDYALDEQRDTPTLQLPSPALNPGENEVPPLMRLDEKVGFSTVASPRPCPFPRATDTRMSMRTVGTMDVERGLAYNPRHEVIHPPPQTSGLFSFIVLICFTGIAGLTAETLVDSIDGMTKATSVSREFIGLILLPVIGNSVEHITAVTVSLKDRLNLSLSIAVGSSVQVSLCLLPLLVLLGWAVGQPMTLLFDTFETICLVVAVILVNFALTGRTNYLQGFTLMMTYVCIAMVCWFYDPAN